jgi:DNA mismatch endonuclease (patch repair protein)
MADVHNKKTRSFNMSMIKEKNTSPEIIVRKFLHSKGYRFRLHRKDLPGKPDIILKKYNTVIFVHGCFWHMHNHCRYFKIPKTRTEWWTEKLGKNKSRDIESISKLRALGWNIIIIWECELKSKNREETLSILDSKLSGIKK